MSRMFQFCSGVSRVVDFDGVTEAGVAPGIQVGDFRSRFALRVIEHVDKGGALFVDSGAFPAFMSGGAEVNFDLVLDRYEQIAMASARPEVIYVVAPDKIGDPGETARLTRLYAERIRRLSARGVCVLVPVQLGKDTMSSTWRELKEFLGTPVIPDMPMRAAAATIDEVVAFLQASGESRIHLLGTSKSRHFDTISFFCPGVVVTADANLIRAAVGEGRPLTEDYREAVNDACGLAWQDGNQDVEDGTEFTGAALNSPGFLSVQEVDRVLEFLGSSDDTALRDAIQRAELGSLIEEDMMALVCVYPLAQIHRARVANKVGPGFRQIGIARHLLSARNCTEQQGTLYPENFADEFSGKNSFSRDQSAWSCNGFEGANREPFETARS